MKTYKQFQENMSKLPGLGGGGGGTDAITDKARTKSFGKRIKDVGKAATTPFRAVLGIKSKPDPLSKFATEEMKTYKQFMEQIVPKDFSPPPFRYMPHIRTPAIKDMEMKHYNNYIKSSGIDYAKKPKKFGKDPIKKKLA